MKEVLLPADNLKEAQGLPAYILAGGEADAGTEHRRSVGAGVGECGKLISIIDSRNYNCPNLRPLPDDAWGKASHPAKPGRRSFARPQKTRAATRPPCCTPATASQTCPLSDVNACMVPISSPGVSDLCQRVGGVKNKTPNTLGIWRFGKQAGQASGASLFVQSLIEKMSMLCAGLVIDADMAGLDDGKVTTLVGEKSQHRRSGRLQQNGFVGQRVGGIRQRRLNIFAGQARIGIQQIGLCHAVGQLAENQLDRDARPANDGLAQHDGWIDLDSIHHHMLSCALERYSVIIA